ncbi:MAG TPA: ABC transporter permease subunit [Tepidisphaeraceae bacterium]|nr:ABC transporter permease subunit [Tepidisphaeraceae bacterium]
MYRTLVILRHTFLEAVVQPIYSLLLALGAAILLIFAALPFFTLGEDTVMFKTVSLDVILLFVLIATLFATSKSIFEEIEDRTMLTLMSKPLKRWEVLLGKYLGIVVSAALAVAILGVVMGMGIWWRIPTDYQFNVRSLDETEIRRLWEYRRMHLAGLYPSLILVWLQIGVLAAISVAISTRVSLVVNLPVVIILYIAGNLTRFLDQAAATQSSIIARGVASAMSDLLPFLAVFDLRQKTVYDRIALPGTAFAADVNAVSLAEIWRYVGIAWLYALAYATFALSAGMLLFQSRELGGGEG